MATLSYNSLHNLATSLHEKKMVGKVTLPAGLTFFHTRLSLPSMDENVASLIFQRKTAYHLYFFKSVPVTRARTTVWTDKKLHGSAFRLHGTRGTVQFLQSVQVFHLIESRLKLLAGTVPFHFNADSCKHLNQVQIKAVDKKALQKCVWTRVNSASVTELARFRVNGFHR